MVRSVSNRPPGQPPAWLRQKGQAPYRSGGAAGFNSREEAVLNILRRQANHSAREVTKALEAMAASDFDQRSVAPEELADILQPLGSHNLFWFLVKEALRVNGKYHRNAFPGGPDDLPRLPQYLQRKNQGKAFLMYGAQGEFVLLDNDGRRELAAGVTVVGRRSGNEDSILARQRGKKIILAVADGMGGYELGEVASMAAILTIMRADEAVDLPELISQCHSAICGPGGTTLALAEIDPAARKLVTAGVGDSLVYLVKKSGAVCLLTRPDIAILDEKTARQYYAKYFRLEHQPPYNEPETEQLLAAIKGSGFSNVITCSLGSGGELPRLQQMEYDLDPGDTVLVVSDGMDLGPGEIKEHFRPDKPLIGRLRALVVASWNKAAKAGHKSDNISAVGYTLPG